LLKSSVIKASFKPTEGIFAMKFKVIAGVASAFVVLCQPAFAASEFATACKADIESVCKGETPAMKCLTANADKLSAECKTAVDERKAAGKALRAACKADIDTMCGGPGDGDVKCLKENSAKVSADCGKALAAF
jgi:hypothetical protein